MPNVMATLPKIGGASVQRPQSLADAQWPDAKAVEITWGAPNWSTDLSRQWAEVHHIAAFWRLLRPIFTASRVQHVSDLHLKFALSQRHAWKYGRHPIYDGW